MAESSVSDLDLYRRMKELHSLTAQNAARVGVGAVDSGGGPPDPPDMEKRLATLEAAMPRIETRLDRVETRLDRMEARADARADATDVRLRAVEQSISRVEGKIDLLEGKMDLLASQMGQIVGKLPTWWQMLAMFVAIAALLNGLPLLTQTLRSRGMVP